MRSEYLLLLFAPLSSALAACHHDAHSALNEALDQVASSYQQPIYAKPHRDHPHEKEEPKGTIYEVIANDPNFSLITKALKFVDDVGAFLNESSARLTFFAPPDKVLRRPRKDDHVALPLSWATIDALTLNDFDGLGYLAGSGDLGQALDLIDELDVDDCLDKPDKEKRKKILKFILRALLNYHIIPTDGYDVLKLGLNTTFPSNLAFPGIFDNQKVRLRVDHILIPPVTTINFYVKITHSDVPASNGVIHVIDHAILPPPSVFQELYLIPRHFSTLTSALQRSGLTEDLDLRYIRDHGLKGASLVTVFAPSNRAFESLPAKLRFFLFSPFGEQVLKKLLEYHIVPNATIFSDYIHHKHAHKDAYSCADNEEIESADEKPWFSRFGFRRQSKHPRIEPISHVNVTLDTLFFNHTIEAVFDKVKINIPFPGHKNPYKIETKAFVNHQPVHIPDIVGLNGAIHVINRLLDPRRQYTPPGHRHRHHHHCHRLVEDEENMYLTDSWDDWEKWLPQWAEE